MYKELEEQIGLACEFFGGMDQTLTKFDGYFKDDNINLVVPEGYCLPIHGCLSYKFRSGLLSIKPREYADFWDDNYTLYGDTVNMFFYFETLKESINSGTLSETPEDLISALDGFVRLKKERLAEEEKGFDLAVKIIEDLKKVNK